MNFYRKARMKKIRGKKNRFNTSVKVSQITSDGFWLHLPKESYYISRAKYPWFKDATHREIQDVRLRPSRLEHEDDCDGFVEFGDKLRWEALDLDFGTNSFKNPEKFSTKYMVVRGVPRPDLFD